MWREMWDCFSMKRIFSYVAMCFTFLTPQFGLIKPNETVQPESDFADQPYTGFRFFCSHLFLWGFLPWIPNGSN